MDSTDSANPNPAGPVNGRFLVPSRPERYNPCFTPFRFIQQPSPYQPRRWYNPQITPQPVHRQNRNVYPLTPFFGHLQGAHIDNTRPMLQGQPGVRGGFYETFENPVIPQARFPRHFSRSRYYPPRPYFVHLSNFNYRMDRRRLLETNANNFGNTHQNTGSGAMVEVGYFTVPKASHVPEQGMTETAPRAESEKRLGGTASQNKNKEALRPNINVPNELQNNGAQQSFESQSQAQFANMKALESLNASESLNGTSIFMNYLNTTREAIKPVYTRTVDGFICDEDGYVEVGVAGMMERGGRHQANRKALYSVRFGDYNANNCAGFLTDGLQTAKGAIIQGSELAILLLKNRAYTNIRIRTDSTFLIMNIPIWAEKYSVTASGTEFQSSNWDEFKYSAEICRLCALNSGLNIKWTLVDPECTGIRKVKAQARKLESDLRANKKAGKFAN